MELNKIYQGDTLKVLKEMPSDFVDCIVTSPPYYSLRDYGIEGQIGLEDSLLKYVDVMLSVMSELKRVIKPTGTLWWNHGDCYGGSKGDKKGVGLNIISDYSKSLVFQHERIAIKMIDEQGWIARNMLIWNKPNPFPSSVQDRLANHYEVVYLFAKDKKYWFDLYPLKVPCKKGTLERYNRGVNKNKSNQSPYSQSISKPRLKGRWHEQENLQKANPGDVWSIPTKGFKEGHFATFPPTLITPMIMAGCPLEVCVKCGKARERILKPSETYAKQLGKGYHDHKSDLEQGIAQHKRKANSEYITTGWTDCGCNKGFKPGVVLDPFMGAGTTAMVSKGIGRDFIGIELNPEYVKMANDRIYKEVGLFLQGE